MGDEFEIKIEIIFRNMDKNNWLDDYRHNEFSQFGEDGIINKIFEIIPSLNKYCVEFGAWDGKILSNCYHLAYDNNWKSIMIEANKKKFKDLVNIYKDKNNVILLNKLVTFTGSNSLDNIFTEYNVPIDFDLLSIDIDGIDYYVWESVIKYKPNLVIIEFNPSIPNDVEFVQEKNIKVNHGSSLLSLIKLATVKGYELICTTHCNGFFIRKELFELFNIKDNNINVLRREDIKLPRIFQMYDGTLMLTEDMPLIWKSPKVVKKTDIQVLPKMFRFYSDSSNNNFFFKLRELLFIIYQKFH